MITQKTTQSNSLAQWSLIAAGILNAAMLLGARAENPYFYYQALRWLTCSLMALYAFIVWHSPQRLRPLAAVPIALAILFNPIVPFYLSKSTWTPIDVGTAAISAVLGVVSSQLMFVAKFGRTKDA